MASRLKLAGQAVAVALVAGLLALLVWKVATDSGANAADKLAGGETPAAPDFTLERLDAPGTLTLSSLRGKAVVINFWASWCEPCKEEAPMLEQAWREYRDDGLVVVGVNIDDFSSDARRFARENGMTYPLVRDREDEVTPDYGVTGVPETLFADRQGKLIARIQGPVEEEELRGHVEAALGA